MKHSIRNRQSGVTLVEVLIASALMSIFMITIVDIFTAALEIQGESQATSTVHEDGRFILQRFTYDVSQASAISTPASAGASNSSLVMTIGGATVTYTLNGSVLQRADTAGTDSLTSSEVTASALNFQRITDNTVRLNVTLTSATTTETGKEVKTYTITAGRRP